MRFRTAALAAVLLASPAAAGAQTAAAPAGSAPAPSLNVDAGMLGAEPTHLSAPAVEVMKGRRSPWVIPAVGVLAGASALTGWTFYGCTQSGDCIIDPVTPVVVGGVAGGVVGALAELALRGVEQRRAEDGSRRR